MAIPIPRYIRHIAKLQKQQKTWTHFGICCTCGCEKFLVYQNYMNKEEMLLEKPYYDALHEMFSGGLSTCTRDEDGTLHHWKLYEQYEPGKGFVRRREEVFLPDRPYFSGIVVIKSKCIKCEKEYLLFDSRMHGYDGMTNEKDQATIEYEPHFKLKCKEAVSLEVKVENDESLEKFQDNTDLGFTEEQFSDAFSWIIIYRINNNGKKAKIFDWETA
ncbi:MAG: hypothetical protein IJZ03_09125 [Clostridia bacterium]|nr:hypothetical protein [Clostridia bacterium]MBQ8743512.1 hypothetical protein [Clostridia bacterium]